MRSAFLLKTLSLALLITILPAAVLMAQQAGETIIKREAIDHDFYAAGRSIHLSGPVNGDVTIAGQRLTLDSTIGGDVTAAAEILTVNGDVQDDIRAAGRLVQVNAAVGDHIVAAGDTLTLAAASKVGGWAWLAGRQVEVLGEIGKELKAAGEHIVIAGEIHGPVQLVAEQVRILETAVIHGPLRVQSPRPPDIAAGARILGDVEHQPLAQIDYPPVVTTVALAGVMFILGLIATGIVYYLLLPGFSVNCARRIGEVPLASLGLGLAVLVLAPLLIMILFSVGVGYLLAALLGAFYFIALVLGALTGVIYIGDVALRRVLRKPDAGKGLTVGALIGAFVLLGLVQLIPVLGALAVLLLSLMGIGALNYQLWQSYRAAHA